MYSEEALDAARAARRQQGFVRYPWDMWTNGQVYNIIRGEDFRCAFSSMKQQLYSRALDIGKKVTVKKFGNSLSFKFYDDDDTLEREIQEELEDGYDDGYPAELPAGF